MHTFAPDRIDAEVAKLLVDKGANIDLVDKVRESGQTNTSTTTLLLHMMICILLYPFSTPSILLPWLIFDLYIL